MSHILVVEDDYDMSNIITTYLSHAAHTFNTAYTGAQARLFINENKYDLVLIDVMLPDTRGDVLCAHIRESGYNMPIIFLSCLDESGDIIGALQAGGDDYVVKPADFSVLLARIERQINRTAKAHTHAGLSDIHTTGTMCRFKSFTIDTARRRVLINGSEIGLSAIEYSLLLYLSRHPDELLLYADLYSHVWQSDCHGDFRTVMVHISNLRKKIDTNHRGIIETVRGAGYIFCNI